MSETYRAFFGLQREPFSADISLREILVTPTSRQLLNASNMQSGWVLWH